MSILGCICGNAIKDTTYPLPYEGDIICQEDYDQILESIGKDVAQFIAAIEQGNRAKWLNEFYGSGYLDELERDFENSEVVEDILSKRFDPILVLTQCENCGRLWVQEEPCSYRSFNPDGEWKGMLRGRIKAEQ